MNRRRFVDILTACSGVLATAPHLEGSQLIHFHKSKLSSPDTASELSADLVICGGGLGGCAAALAALRNHLKVILTEETKWIGGQISQQGVPPDEHQWIETHGATQLYREFRSSVRKYYRTKYPLTTTASTDKYLNPGNGSVSRLCFEPAAGVAVLTDMLAPYIKCGKLTLLTEHKIKKASINGYKINAVSAINKVTQKKILLSAPFFIDATELGDLLPLTGTAFVSGSESRSATGELHASENANPDNNQAFTSCFAVDYLPGEDHTIEKPASYKSWREFQPQLTPPWPGKLLDLHYSNPSTMASRELAFNPEGVDTSPLMNLWEYRRIIDKTNFIPNRFQSDITIVNWPQNDYMTGNILITDEAEIERHIENSRQLSLSLLYWLQTEAPRPDKGYGWKGLRLRKDIMGTEDGLAQHPYIRESRRIKARFTILEEHVGKANRSMVAGNKAAEKAADFYDSIGIGYYHIDLHPTCGGDNYIDFDSLPFQIPLGALIPEHTINLIPANKNIGTTHITNGCYRLHPVEWNIGEAAGSLIAFAHKKKESPASIYENKELLRRFQEYISRQGIEIRWPL